MVKFPRPRVPPPTSSHWGPRWISTCSSRNRFNLWLLQDLWSLLQMSYSKIILVKLSPIRTLSTSLFRSSSAILTTPRRSFGPRRDCRTGIGIQAPMATQRILPPRHSRFLNECRITALSTCTLSWCRRASRQIHRRARGDSPRSGRFINTTS